MASQNAYRDGNFVPTVLFEKDGAPGEVMPGVIDEITGRILVDLPGGSGDVVGPASATDNAVARFDGTTGKLIQNSAVIIADTTGAISGTQQITFSGATSGTLVIKPAAVAGTNTITFPAGTTDFSATGGSGHVLRQSSAGAAITVSQLAASDLSNGTTGTGAVVLANSPTFTDDITLGAAASATGSIIFKGTTSGTVTVKTKDAAGTWTLTLPDSDGDSGQVLSTDGNGVTSWASAGGVPTTITVADEATDTTCFVAFFTAATGDLGPKTNTNLTFNSNTGVLTSASSVLTTTDINGGTIDGTIIGGSSAAAITGTVITANTSVLPDADGGAALGSATLGFSILGLASASTINWANGNAVLTHSSGVLTVSTGDLRVTTAGTNSASAVTVGGTQTLTSKTLTSPTINTATLGGTQQFAEGASIAYDAASSADGVYNGFVRAGTAGTTLAFGDLVYLASADSRWELADADSATTADRFLGMCVLAAASDGDPTTILLQGFIRADAAFPALTIGSPVYVGETAGDIQTAIPTGADNIIRRVGYAWTADELYFNPSMDSQVTVA